MNKMREIMIEKITLNVGVGAPGEKLEKATRLLSVISGSKAIQTKAKPGTRIPTWGVRPNLPLGSKVTIRGKKTEELLKRLFQALDNKLAIRKFDSFGNFSFGIKEYIDIPDVPYDQEIGIIGLEAAVTLGRPGFRIKRRSVMKKKVGKKHCISRDEAVKFVKDKFGVSIGDEE